MILAQKKTDEGKQGKSKEGWLTPLHPSRQQTRSDQQVSSSNTFKALEQLEVDKSMMQGGVRNEGGTSIPSLGNG